MSDIYRKAIGDTHVLEVIYDEMCENPRTSMDNLGKMITFHRRYNIGDKHNYSDKDSFLYDLMVDTLGDLEKVDRKYERIEKELSGVDRGYSRAFDEKLLEVIATKHMIFPIYLYDHSIQSISMGSFIGRAVHAEWDSGQIGWVYISHADIRKEYGCKRITKAIREKVEKVFEGEVETYDQYMRGDVYGFKLYKIDLKAMQAEDVPLIDAKADYGLMKDFMEEEDSCWGFFGDDWKNNGVADYVPSELHNLLDALH